MPIHPSTSRAAAGHGQPNAGAHPEDPLHPAHHMFERFSPSHRLSAEPIRYTQQAGWLCAVLAFLLLWADPGKAPPGFWSILGMAMGTLLIIRGSLRLPLDKPYRLAATERLVASRDRWFPFLLFGAQTLFFLLIESLLWFTLPLLGVRLHIALHIGLFSLIVLITVRRLISEWASVQGPSIRMPVQDSLQYATIIIMTLLLAVAGTHAVSPFGHPITGDNSMPIVIIWIIAVFVILCCVVLWIDRLFGRRRG